MRALSAAVLVAAASIGCTEVPQSPMAEPTRPSMEISDGAHGSGNPFFYFLPPMVSNPRAGVNVSGLAPEVKICGGSTLTGCPNPIARFTTDLNTTTTQAGNSETIRESDGGYIVNWHTTAFDLVVGATYRICGIGGASGLALGHADITVVGSGKDLKDVNTGEFIGLLDDRTLPIKFRIEDGAQSQPTDPGCSSQPE